MRAMVASSSSGLTAAEEGALRTVFNVYTLCAALWPVFATVIGNVLAFKFVYPEFWAHAGWLTFGRLRPIHTNDTLLCLCEHRARGPGLLHRGAQLAGAPVQRQARVGGAGVVQYRRHCRHAFRTPPGWLP